MNGLVTRINYQKDWLGQQTWIVPACFGFSCFLTLASLTAFALRGLEGIKPEWMFSMGADLFCMFICTMLCFSATLNGKARSSDTHAFVTLLTTNAFALFADMVCWLVQGIPQFRMINLTANVLFYMVGSILIYLFWEYIRRALRLNDRPMKAADTFVTAMLYPSLILCLVNFVYPLYFQVDENGVYSRAPQYDVSQVYLSIALSVVIISIIFSKASMKDRLVAVSFVAIPLVNQILTSGQFGFSTQYAAMTISIVLIYGVLVADREKTLASTEMELGVATKIQANMLPNTFPFMPENGEFDLFASMTPAKEVGGDFYDFFMVDDNHLALVIADVSGKGIPAALFMMASKILIKNTVMTGKSPGEALETVNRQICENNDEEMFVTVWLGVLNLDDGTLVTANAGHEYPVFKSPDGNFELLKTRHSFVIGGMDGIKYKETEIKLEAGSKLFVYTDGVVEAENENEDQYGYDRFLSVLNKNKDASPKELLSAVSADVKAFTKEQPQFDDLTMLCINYLGKKKELTVDAVVENIEVVTDFINAELEKIDCPMKAVTQISVAIDELFGNIAKYSYSPDVGKATVRFNVENNPLSVIITFIDNGKPFNPLENPEPDVTLSASEREVGGLGIFLVKKTMNMVDYKYENGKNILTIKKNI